MANFPGKNYAPPGVYTRTQYENPTQPLLAGLKLPMFLGTGSEILSQMDLEVVRGSSSKVDQRVVGEDMAGRSVVSISNTGVITLGAFDGVQDRIQVRNYPVVTGAGTGTTATDSSAVSVTINDLPVVVLQMSGTTGVFKLSTAPKLGDVVRVSYFFNRTDTQTTDAVSAQVDSTTAIIYGAMAESYTIVTGENDTLAFTVDDATSVSVTIPASNTGAPWSASQMASFINSGAFGTSLVASAYVNNFGVNAVQLVADRNLVVGNGTANSTVGFTNGDATLRNKTFYTFEGPIVDGTNGGVTTTDPADTVVKVNGVQIIPVSVDGQTRAVVLPFAPEVGAVVTVQYYFNTWQDTFDYLAHTEVTTVLRAGATPDRSDYLSGSDFVLQGDKILWGTAATVASGVHTAGTSFLDSTQITPTLVDVRQYLAEATAVTNTAVSPPQTSTTVFQMPLAPTTGNGRSTPLGQSLYQSVTNSRIDLPTNRPDLVQAYWGFGVQDAMDRGPVTVTKVDSASSTLTLASAVPVGAQVFVSFYYNTLADQDYTLTVENPGAAGVGTYSIVDASGVALPTPLFGTKSAGLAGVALQFPSGSERSPDVRFESPFTTTLFSGAVEEDVTVTFASLDSTLAKFSVGGSNTYYAISGASDNLNVLVDGSSVTGSAVNFTAVNGVSGLGFHASLLGEEVSYTAASGDTTFVIDSTNSEINLTVDGKLIAGVANQGASQTIAAYAAAINRASVGEQGTAAAGGASSITFTAAASDQTDYYVGWTVVLTNNTVVGTQGLTATVTAYNGSTKVATVTPGWATVPDATTTFAVFDPAARPQYIGATKFSSASTITAGEYDTLVFHYTGDVTGVSGNLTAVVAPATYASATALAVAVNAAIATQVATLGSAFDGVEVAVTANANAQLVFSLTKAGLDGAGFLEFITGVSTADFAILGGISTAAATVGGQVKLVDGPVARAFRDIGNNTGAYLNDRLVLRNRLVPGAGSVDHQWSVDQSSLQVEGSSGAAQAGLVVNSTGSAGWHATVIPATLAGVVGFADGQAPTGTYGDARDGQPVVTFYAAGGTTAQNNEFKFLVDGVPVTVLFTDASGVAIATGGTADVPVGPSLVANTVINQIAVAMANAGLAGSAAAVIAAGMLVQEGAGFRIRSALSSTLGTITIGASNANTRLGFVSGASASRSLATPKKMASALMAHAGATLAVVLMTTWTTGLAATGYFAGEALAGVVQDASNAEYLFFQSMGNAGRGVSSSIAFAAAATQSALLPGVGLGVVAGDGASGEVGVSGYYVTSTDALNGSGTANTSMLNTGSGQDGIIGQTYRDSVTGLTFTVLERAGGIAYPAGETFTFTVRNVTTSDSNLPIRTVPGVELLVTNTLGVGVQDTAKVSTFKRSGNEPTIGDTYYISYEYQKRDFTAKVYTKFATLQAEYGANSPQNPVTLASYFAILNGAVLVGVKQVEKDIDENNDGIPDSASVTSFISSVDALEGAMSGNVLPNILIPLDVPSASTADFLAYITRHADIQSTIRYRAERTVLAGFPAGTTPRTAGDIAESIKRSRLRVVYPDIATLVLTQADGTEQEFLVDGTMLAASLAGSVVKPSVDVATAWTGRKLYGIKQIARILNVVEQNQLAVRGVTILEDNSPAVRVRQGFTTDMSSILTKTPTVTPIADEVQQQTRNTLDRFTGIKFLPGILSQVEGQTSTTLKLLVDAEILAKYTGVRAQVVAGDPTAAEVEAFYQPVFPLLYLIVSFNLRSSL